MKFIPNTDAADITAVVAGTNLSGGATSGSATITLADARSINIIIINVQCIIITHY